MPIPLVVWGIAAVAGWYFRKPILKAADNFLSSEAGEKFKESMDEAFNGDADRIIERMRHQVRNERLKTLREFKAHEGSLKLSILHTRALGRGRDDPEINGMVPTIQAVVDERERPQN